MNKPQTSESDRSDKICSICHRIFMVIGIVACIGMILIVIFNFILIVKGYANKNEVPSIFSVSPLYVMTDSMSPIINGGDLVFIKKVELQDIANDDIIAFFDPAGTEKVIVVHRVKDITIDENGVFFVTKGDNNNTYDSIAVPYDNVVGKYIFRLQGMGNIAMFMQSTYGFIICVCIPY